MRDALVLKWRVPEENIRLLVDHQATRAAIEESITGWLASNAGPDDVVTVYFAGHGSQMWDESGDEDDGLDETLAPADVLATSTEFDISDDTFGEWLATVRSTNVGVFLDNCSSGTGTRDVTPFSRGRLLARDIDDVQRPATASRRALPGQQDDTGFDAGQARVLELSAAQPNQVAVETFFPGAEGAESYYGGAFTTFLVQQLWRAPADATYQQVFEATYEALKRNRFQQDPYISEDVSLKDRPVFLGAAGSRAGSDMVLPVTEVSLEGPAGRGPCPRHHHGIHLRDDVGRAARGRVGQPAHDSGDRSFRPGACGRPSTPDGLPLRRQPLVGERGCHRLARRRQSADGPRGRREHPADRGRERVLPPHRAAWG
jgi:hypothetical protein